MTGLSLLFRPRPGTLAALAAEHVIETMRPLPCEPVAGAPPFVAGVAIIRGRPTPVVDVGALLGAPREALSERWITVAVGERVVGLAVSDVVGVRRLTGDVAPGAMPPLLTDAARGAVSALGVLDGELLLVLERASLVPDDVLALTAPASGDAEAHDAR